MGSSPRASESIELGNGGSRQGLGAAAGGAVSRGAIALERRHSGFSDTGGEEWPHLQGGSRLHAFWQGGWASRADQEVGQLSFHASYGRPAAWRAWWIRGSAVGFGVGRVAIKVGPSAVFFEPQPNKPLHLTGYALSQIWVCYSGCSSCRSGVRFPAGELYR